MKITIAKQAIMTTCLLLAPALLAQPAQKPNIVIILSDDLGYGSATSYGADPKLIQTPSIDRLAREGRRFSDASSSSSVCTPTRYSMLTGRYAWRTSLKRSVLKTDSPLLITPGRPTLASMLKKQGYRTAAIGKWHLGYGRKGKVDYTKLLKPGPLEIGFDYHFGVPANHGDSTGVYVENHQVWGLRSVSLNPESAGVDFRNRPYLGLDAPHRVDVEVMPFITNKAVEWIESQTSTQPFFLFFTPVAVHDPVTPSAQTAGTSKAGSYGDWIHELDDSVGAILDALDSGGFTNNTVVLFTSDNGGIHKPSKRTVTTQAAQSGLTVNGHFRGGKHDIWEGGFRVPYLLRWPGHIPADTVSDAMLNLVDTFATLAELVGAPVPEPSTGAEDSFSMLSNWLGKSSTHVRPDMILHSHDGTFAIRKGPWKWIEGDYHPLTRARYIQERADQFRPQLFNIAEDAHETENLAAHHPYVASDLASLLNRYRDGGYSRSLPPPSQPLIKLAELTPAEAPSKSLDPAELLQNRYVSVRGKWNAHNGELEGHKNIKSRETALVSIPLKTTNGDISYEVDCPFEACHSLRIHANGNESVYMVSISQRWLSIIKYPGKNEPETKTVLAQTRLPMSQKQWMPVHVQMRGDELAAQVGSTVVRAQGELFTGYKLHMVFLMDGQRARFRNISTLALK